MAEQDASIGSEIRESAKNLFEEAMSFMIDHYREGNLEKGNKMRATLIEAYRSSVDSNGRLLAKVKELGG